MPRAASTPARTTPPRPAAGPSPAWIIPAALIAAITIAASVGGSDPLLARLIALVSAVTTAGWTPAAYLLGAIGLGRLARPLTRTIPGAPALNAGIGLALTLTATHALGALGGLNPITAWLCTGAGLLLLADDARRAARQPGGFRLPAITPFARAALALASVGLAVMLVATASPPGSLWDSEFRAYDSLSYHLQLPAEWLEAGRIAPLAHNVYSFLPGYYEAALVHLAHLSITPPTTPDGLTGLLAGSGEGVLAAHFLALGLTLFGAWTTGAFARALALRCNLDDAAATGAGFVAAALVVLTPWSQVVGSLAYNEPGVVALGAAGLLAATAPTLTPIRRAVLVAVLIGAAAGCKPTAVLFLAPGAAILMAMSAPVRTWAVMFGIGAAVGLLTLAPWLARNAAHGGNPIFPQGTAIFGHAHWTAEQAARFAGAHRFEGDIAERLATLIAPAAEVGSPAVVRWRGLTNPQWTLTPWLGLLGLALMIARRHTHLIGVALLGATVAAIVAWYAFTHLQSRFLIPLLPFFVAAFALGAATLPVLPRRLTVLAALAVSAAWSITNFATQRASDPNALLTMGPGVFSGTLPLLGLGDQVVSAGVNETVPPGETLLLVGDATPFYYHRPVVYATTWDTHPLAQAIATAPDAAPQAWTDALRAQGLEWVLVSFAELDRLHDSDWSDPALTPDRVDRWTRTLEPPVRVWPEQGVALFRIRSRTE